MAMNKTEKIYVEKLENDLRIAKAFRFTEQVLPDLAPPDSYDELVKGFSFNSYARRIDASCTSKGLHSTYSTEKATTHGSIHLYSTERLALKAMRNELEVQFAKELAKIDERIEKSD